MSAISSDSADEKPFLFGQRRLTDAESDWWRSCIGEAVSRDDVSSQEHLNLAYLATLELVQHKEGIVEGMKVDDLLQKVRTMRSEKELLKARLVRGLFLAVGAQLPDDPEKVASIGTFSLVMGVAKTTFQWGGIRVNPWNGDVPCGSIHQVSLGSCERKLWDHAGAAFQKNLDQGTLFTYGNIFRGMCFQLVRPCMLSWLSRGAAILAGRQIVAAEDLKRAEELVSRILQPTGPSFEVFRGSLFGNLLEDLFQNSSLAHALVHRI